MTRRLLLCLVTVAITLACGGNTSANVSSSGGASNGGQTITFKETEYTIDPAKQTLKPGDYTFQVQNLGQFPHDLHVATSDGSEVGGSAVFKGNESGSFKVTLKPGTYTLWCSVDSHRSLGMEATITVQ